MMNKKATHLLLTSSLAAFFAVGSVYASASSLGSPEETPDIEVMASKGFLKAFDTIREKEVSGFRLSNRGDLIDRSGQQYREYYMLGDGNCGLYSMGFDDHAEAKTLLLSRAGDQAIREIAHHQILADFMSNRLPQVMYNNDLLRDWANERDNFAFLASPQAGLSADERDGLVQGVSTLREMVADWARTQEAYEDYVNHFLVKGQFIEYNEDEPGRPQEPTFLNVLARILNKNLEVYIQTDRHGNILTDRRDDNRTLSLSHHYNIGSAETLYLISRGGHREGGHFNRLVPVSDEAAMELAKKKERMFMNKYVDVSRDQLKKTLMTSAKLSQKRVINTLATMSGLDAEISDALAPVRRFLDTQSDVVELEKDPNKVSAQTSTTMLLLARAFALNKAILDKRYEGMPSIPGESGEDHALYTKWCNALKSQIPASPLNEANLSQELFKFYQGVRGEVDRLGSITERTPDLDAYEKLMRLWEKVLRPVTEKASSTFGDGHTDYLRGYVQARQKNAMAPNITITEVYAPGTYTARPLTTNDTKAAVRSFLLSRPLPGDAAYLNNDLIMMDPFLESYNYGIEADPKYKTPMTSREIQDFKQSLYQLVKDAKVARFAKETSAQRTARLQQEEDDNRAARYRSEYTADPTVRLPEQLAKLRDDELSWRRLKRLYEHHLGGETSQKDKYAAAEEVMNAVLMNWTGCVDGVKTAIRTAERYAFFGESNELAYQRISQLITANRHMFVRSYKDLLTPGSEPYKYVPDIVESSLLGAFAMPGSVAPQNYNCCSDIATRPPFNIRSVLERYFNGGTATYGGSYGDAPRRIVSVAHTPDYFSNMLFAMDRLGVLLVNSGAGNSKASLLSKAGAAEKYQEIVSLFPEIDRISTGDFEEYAVLSRGFHELMERLIEIDPFLLGEMEEVVTNWGRSDYFSEDSERPYKKPLFDYVLRKMGYVIDPNAPAHERSQYWWNTGMRTMSSSDVTDIFENKCYETQKYYAEIMGLPTPPRPVPAVRRDGVSSSSSDLRSAYAPGSSYGSSYGGGSTGSSYGGSTSSSGPSYGSPFSVRVETGVPYSSTSYSTTGTSYGSSYGGGSTGSSYGSSTSTRPSHGSSTGSSYGSSYGSTSTRPSHGSSTGSSYGSSYGGGSTGSSYGSPLSVRVETGVPFGSTSYTTHSSRTSTPSSTTMPTSPTVAPTDSSSTDPRLVAARRLLEIRRSASMNVIEEMKLARIIGIARNEPLPIDLMRALGATGSYGTHAVEAPSVRSSLAPSVTTSMSSLPSVSSAPSVTASMSSLPPVSSVPAVMASMSSPPPVSSAPSVTASMSSSSPVVVITTRPVSSLTREEQIAELGAINALSPIARLGYRVRKAELEAATRLTSASLTSPVVPVPAASRMSSPVSSLPPEISTITTSIGVSASELTQQRDNARALQALRISPQGNAIQARKLERLLGIGRDASIPAHLLS